MIALISPSKNLHNHPVASHRASLPRLPEESQKLIQALIKLKVSDLQDLMEINEKLAVLNYNRYRQFSWPHTPDKATAAIYTFRGEVYLGFEAQTMSAVEAEKADKSVRILSGLYGLLKPLDLIQPYRLEMGRPLKIGRTKDLYAFWGHKITDLLQQDITATKSKAVINLASQEYIQAVHRDALSVPVIDVQFLEDRNGKLQFLSYNAKRSRGWLARYIVNHDIKKTQDLKQFSEHGYLYRDDLSDSTRMVFVR